MARVVLAMSGGVDSSVAAWLLGQQGHEVIGLFMRHGVRSDAFCAAAPDNCAAGADNCASGADNCASGALEPIPQVQGCCSAADAADARRVAEMLGIPFYALNFESEFGRIVDYFVDEYAAGRTPNPCIVCNNWLKFGKLFEYADSVGADYVSTGHYARLVPAGDPEAPALCRGLDDAKDQSYVLFGVRRSLLGRLLFPVGEYRKEKIRQIAGRLGLAVAGKRDSQEICFAPPGEHAGLVKRLRAGHDTSGQIVTTDGTVVGRHPGLEHFTIGQRKGLGVAFGERRYVVRLELQSRRVVLGTHDELARGELIASGANWLAAEPTEAFDCQVKIRYRSRPVEAIVRPLPGDRFAVEFAEPRHGVAPGQAIVCYDGDRVLGGGWIE